MTLNWNPRLRSFLSICEVILSKPTWLRGKTVAVWDIFAAVKEVRRCKERKSCLRGKGDSCLRIGSWLEVMFRGGRAVILKRGSVLFVDGWSFGLASWLHVTLIQSPQLEICVKKQPPHLVPKKSLFLSLTISMMAAAMSVPRLSLLASIQAFVRPLSLSALAIPTTIHLNIPALFPGIFESILRAVPKKKQSHARRRMRQLAGKALKDVLALNKCSVCGEIKRQHVLCEHCVAAIKGMWRREQGAGIVVS